ncbi:zf-TFIIB domain-containing protein [Kiritimatiellaeota bacterium B1221]|nr:zf-TFIIB domain-containing protein [Kiritimatiellaeota bacterium B1221]
MKCPTCSSKRTASVSLTDGLTAQKCENCDGQWIPHKNYEAWQKSLTEIQAEKPFTEVQFEVEDQTGARLCPDCGKILLKYKVGHGLNFFVDYCSACGGIWLDKNEWQALEAQNLHDELHRIFSTAWQKQIREENLAQTMESVFKKRFGEESYSKIKDIREWINEHPQKDQLLAFLTE